MKKNISKIVTFVIILLVFQTIYLKGQGADPTNAENYLGKNKILPPSPTASSLGKYGETPVSNYTGIPEINIPIYQIQAGSLTLPISLSYHASGIKVEERASWVGLGWALNAGGVITRTVRSKPDEYSNGYEQNFNWANSESMSISNAQKIAIINGNEEVEPDVYYYNFNGRSGRLIYLGNNEFIPSPYADIKFTRIKTGISNINWNVIDENGIHYQFSNNATEVSSSPSIGIAKTAWYLTEISSSNIDNHIFFEYDNPKVITVPGIKAQNLLLINNPASLSTIINFTNDDVDEVFHTTIKLKRIAFHETEILFNCSSREDIDNESKLNSIQVNKSGNVNLKYIFTYTYFNNIEYNPTITKRLKLDKIQQCDANGNCLATHDLEYYDPDSLPFLNSLSQDYWGYFNGITNSNLIPSGLIGPCSFVGGNRQSTGNINIANKGTLKKITYPTGGNSVFTYETNDYYSMGDEYKFENATAHATSSNHANNSIGNEYKNIHSTFFKISPIDQNVTVEAYFNTSVDPSPYTWFENYVTGEIQIIDSTTNEIIWSVSHSFSDQESHELYTLNLLKGSYILRVIVEAIDHRWPNSSNYINTVATGNISYYKPIADNEFKRPCGGIRIKKIEDNFATISSLNKIRTFEYLNVQANGEIRSSGRLLIKPKYITTYSVINKVLVDGGCGACPPFFKCVRTNYNNISGNPISPLGSIQSNLIGYDKVTVYYDENKATGKSEYEYSIAPGREMGTLFSPIVNGSYKGGQLLKEKVFKKDLNNNYVLIKSKENEYTFYNQPGSPNFKKVYGYMVKWLINSDDETCGGYDRFFESYYDVTSEWFVKNSETNTQYDMNGQNPNFSTTKYFYDNPSHAQLTRTETTNSDGSIYKTYSKFPQDYNDPTGLIQDDACNAIHKMINEKHIHNIPLEKYSTIQRSGGTEKISGGSLTLYKEFPNGFINPEKEYSLLLSSPQPMSWYDGFKPSVNNSGGNSVFGFGSGVFERKFTYDNYDVHGNLLQYHKEKDSPNSFQWDSNGYNPIASFTNAVYSNNVVGNECSFSGFESSGTADDHWAGSVSSNQTQSHTGKWSVNISTGNQLSHDFYPDHQNQRYRFSCWVKFPAGYNTSNGSLAINAKSSLAGAPLSGSQSISFTGIANEWSYQEVILNLESIHSSLGNSSNFWIECIIKNMDPLSVNIDDIRFEPIPSETKTINYDPLFDQVSSISDQNSLPQYFDYDNFGRLQNISDLDGKVLKKYGYHYKDPGNANDYNKVSETNFRLPFTASQVNSNIPAWNDFNKTNSYLDGLGRLIQTVNEKQSPDAQDIIIPIVYDQFGRTPKNYLPYSINSNNGSFDANALSGASNLNSFYLNAAFVPHTTYPYAESVFEASPLNRITVQGSVGDTWQVSTAHTTKVEYGTNAANEVFQWQVDLSSGFPTGASYLQSYPANSLFKKVITDEENKQGFEYTDLAGRLIAKVKNVLVDQTTGETFDFFTGHTQTTCSTCISKAVTIYYVYDDFDRLSYVVPQGALTDLQNVSAFSESDAIFNKWIYGYHYDEKGRQTEKKIPGESWEYFIYNNIDNLIMSQNGNERLVGGWKCFKYDALHRNIINGYSLQYPGSRQSVQALADIHNLTNSNYEKATSIGSALFNYSNNAFPTLIPEIFSINYYDGYDYESQVPVNSPYAAPSAKSIHTNGLMTGTLTRLNPNAIPATYLLDKNYYDDKSRAIETHKQHQLGGWDKYNNQYDFVGQLTASTRLHTSSQHAAITIATQNAYDHAGRLIDIRKQIDSDPQILMVHNDYNKLGQLITKKLHNTISTNFLQTIDYRYNIRGWLTSINNSTITNDGGVKNTDAEDAFGEEILYNDVSEISTGLNNLVPIGKYDGNISSVKWKFRSPNSGLTNVTTPVRAYVYRYDDLNRMTAGYYCENSAQDVSHFNSAAHFYDETLRYDAMGNIKRLDRMYKGTSIDALVYNYTGNQATDIHDNITQVYSRGFKDGTNTNADYEYDSNGNQKTDRNKGLSLLYNVFNLPKTVTSSNGTAINYLYDGVQGKRQ